MEILNEFTSNLRQMHTTGNYFILKKVSYVQEGLITMQKSVCIITVAYLTPHPCHGHTQPQNHDVNQVLIHQPLGRVLHQK